MPCSDAFGKGGWQVKSVGLGLSAGPFLDLGYNFTVGALL